MRRIKLTQGRFATVDDDLYDKLVAMGSWCYSSGYAVNKRQRMHRVVFKLSGLPVPKQVDHKNRRKCDNRLCNLRPSTLSQNKANQSLQANNTSGYRGVHWRNKRRRWEARIRVNGKERYLGCFNTARQAAVVYDAAALDVWGSFAWLNFPRQVHRAKEIKSQQQRRMRSDNSSGYAGVSWHAGKWRATTTLRGKTVHLGRFDSKRVAAKAYKDATVRDAA